MDQYMKMAPPEVDEEASATTLSPFEQTYRGIMRCLYEGSLIPGQRLAAPDLMLRFNVGRGTVREVLHRLASSGVITIIPNRGAIVRHLTRHEVDGILDIVEVLLGLAARGAAGAINEPNKRAELLRLHHALGPQAAESFTEFLQAREAYYRFIVQASGNYELQRLFPIAQVHIMRVQLRNYDRAADAVDPRDYAELTKAVISGDAAKAEAAGRRHVGYTRQRVAKLPERAFAFRT